MVQTANFHDYVYSPDPTTHSETINLNFYEFFVSELVFGSGEQDNIGLKS